MLYKRNIPTIIQKKLFEKQDALARLEQPPPTEAQIAAGADPNITKLKFGDIATRTIYARMISDVPLNTAKDGTIIDGPITIMGGDVTDGKTLFGFDDIYRTQKVTWTTIGSNPEKKPLGAFIKNITLEYKDAMAAVRKATIEWSVWSSEELDKFSEHFLTIGCIVSVDFGWVYKNDITTELDTLANNVGSAGIRESAYQHAAKIVLDKGGDYDGMVGVVKNFNYSLRQDGGYDCTTELMTMGSNIFSKSLDTDVGKVLNIFKAKDPNASHEEDKNNKLYYTSYENLISTIRELEQHILFGPLSIFKYGIPNISEEQKQKQAGSQMELVMRKHNPQVGKPIGKSIGEIVAEAESRGDELTFDFGQNKWVFNTDEHKQIIFAHNKTNNAKPTETRMWVTLGWLEDNILNRYLSFVSDTSDDEAIITLRSIEAFMPKTTSKPITVKELKETPKYYKDYFGADAESLDTVESDVGAWLRTKLNFAHEDDYSDTDIVKISTRIKYDSMLKFPVDPFKFVLPGVSAGDKNLFTGGVKKEHYSSLYEELHYMLKDEDNGFSKFVDSIDVDGQSGYLRNIFISVDEIKKAFKVDKKEASDASNKGFVGEPNFLTGYNRLLSNLSHNFHGFWDFELAQSHYDTNNVKVIDGTYSPTLDLNWSKRNEFNLYKFPSFQLDSIVKSQNLVSKVPSAFGLAAMFENNRAGDGLPFYENLGSHKHSMGGLTITDDEKVRSAYLKNLKLAHSSITTVDGQIIYSNFGNKSSNPNAPIKRRGSLLGISQMSPLEDYNKWKGGTNALPSVDAGWVKLLTNFWDNLTGKNKELTPEQQDTLNTLHTNILNGSVSPNMLHDWVQTVSIANNKSYKDVVKVLKAQIGKPNETVAAAIDNRPATGKIITKENLEKALDAEMTLVQTMNPTTPNFFDLTSLPKEVVKGLGNATFLITHPILKGKQTNAIPWTATKNDASTSGYDTLHLNPLILSTVKTNLNHFRKLYSDPMIPLDLSLEIDGIGGIVPGQIFHTDYIKDTYKNVGEGLTGDTKIGPPVYWQVKGLTQKVSSEGWVTEVVGQTRNNSQVTKYNVNKILEKDITEVETNLPIQELTTDQDRAVYNTLIDEISTVTEQNPYVSYDEWIKESATAEQAALYEIIKETDWWTEAERNEFYQSKGGVANLPEGLKEIYNSLVAEHAAIQEAANNSDGVNVDAEDIEKGKLTIYASLAKNVNANAVPSVDPATNLPWTEGQWIHVNPIRGYIREAMDGDKFLGGLIEDIIFAESTFKPDSIGTTGNHIGLGQFLPASFEHAAGHLLKKDTKEFIFPSGIDEHENKTDKLVIDRRTDAKLSVMFLAAEIKHRNLGWWDDSKEGTKNSWNSGSVYYSKEELAPYYTKVAETQDEAGSEGNVLTDDVSLEQPGHGTFDNPYIGMKLSDAIIMAGAAVPNQNVGMGNAGFWWTNAKDVYDTDHTVSTGNWDVLPPKSMSWDEVDNSYRIIEGPSGYSLKIKLEDTVYLPMWGIDKNLYKWSMDSWDTAGENFIPAGPYQPG